MDTTHRTTAPRLSEDERHRLHTAGQAAYHRPGATRAPTTDPAVTRHAVGPVGGTFTAACRAWQAGWDAAASHAARHALTDH